MKALCWHGAKDIRCDEVPDPKIEHPRDAIVKVTSCAICGSDLHLYDGYMPGMENGDVMGHEFMGEVVEVGPDSKHALKVGERVVIPFTIICGECEQCRGPVRIHPSHGRLPRRPGGVCPGSVRRQDAHQGARERAFR
jgi:threonine dehydrogenase-like Zn-dependent dehydrogenase